MTIAEVKTMLESINGYSTKVAYRFFPETETPSMPYIVFYEEEPNVFAADGVVFFASKGIVVELYTEYRTLNEEAKIEQKLTNNGIVFRRDEEYIDDEKCYMISYEFEV